MTNNDSDSSTNKRLPIEQLSGDTKARAIARIQHWIDHVEELSTDGSETQRDIDLCLEVLRDPRTQMESFQSEKDSVIASESCPFSEPKLIGSGGFGLVWRVHHSKLGKSVALKILRPSRGRSNEARLRFLSEAQTGLQLSHPGIVPVYDSGRLGSLLYIECPVIDGGNLAEWLRNNHKILDPRDVAAFVTKMADAFHYAHTKAILHRDIKPSNVLLSPLKRGTADKLSSFEPLITDFGLAKQVSSQEVESLTEAGALIGTAQYMSPEQARGDWSAFNTTSEIFSLGIILYQLLTGKMPFEGSSSAAIRHAINEQSPIRPCQHRHTIPRDLEAITLQCLQRSVTQRYQSMHELQQDLQRFLRGEPVLARKTPWITTTFLAVRRHPVLSGLFATAGMLMVLAIVGLIAAWRIATLAMESERKSNARHFGLYVDFAEKALTGQTPVVELFKRSVEANLAYQREQIALNPNNVRAWHRVSLLKHLSSLAHAHEGLPVETVRARIEAYGILDRLVKTAPDLNPKVLKYQRFYSANALLNDLAGNEKLRDQVRDWLIQNGMPTEVDELLRMARQQISELCTEFPEEVDYQNALADCTLSVARFTSDNIERQRLVEEARSLARQGWEKHKDRPILAKPIFNSLIFQAALAKDSGRIDESLEALRQGDRFYDEAFAKVKKEMWAESVYLELADVYIGILSGQSLDDEVDRMTTKSINIAKDVLVHNPGDIEVRSRLCVFYAIRHGLNSKRGNQAAADDDFRSLKSTIEGCTDPSHIDLCRKRLDSQLLDRLN